MSVRLLTSRLVKHGRYFLQSYWKRDIHNNILEQNRNKNRHHFSASASVLRVNISAPTKTLKNAVNIVSGNQTTNAAPQSGIFRFGQHARKLFINNILNRVTTNYSEELRSQATKKLFYGDSAPFFALVGVSLASGAGVLSKEDELEGVCWEIREAAHRLQSLWNNDDVSVSLTKDFSIDKLEIGPPIAKGCAAVVYAASFKNTDDVCADLDNIEADETLQREDPSAGFLFAQESFLPEMMSPIQNISRFVHNFGGSVDNLYVYNQNSAAVAYAQELIERDNNKENVMEGNSSVDDDAIVSFSARSSSMQELEYLEITNASINRYPIALKMMFNYDIQSNAFSILRAMYKETVPARQRYLNELSEDWERLVQDQTLSLPPHPNIVCMYGFFCDEVRDFPGGQFLYPIAQPQRINPNGYGRNMSLYLLMKRYDYSLRALLDTHELNSRTKLLLLAQLLEAVAHINRHGIAHRDIKSDNILIELNDDNSSPVLVLSDFGCCLADKINGLHVPYPSLDIDKGGNAALMAPEIINKQPGSFAVLNYSKSDLWACGAIAYEIFGLPNPFYSISGGIATTNVEQAYSLRNSDYKENELPPLSEDCPALVQKLIYNILNPNPSKRVSPDIAANVMELFLWAPSNWLKSGNMPNSPSILQWLLSLTTKIMCEGRSTSVENSVSFNQGGRRTYVEYLLISSFLSRARLRRIRGALNWIQNVA